MGYGRAHGEACALFSLTGGMLKKVGRGMARGFSKLGIEAVLGRLQITESSSF